jgi:sugar phosphate isomerase/epimerase
MTLPEKSVQIGEHVKQEPTPHTAASRGLSRRRFLTLAGTTAGLGVAGLGLAHRQALAATKSAGIEGGHPLPKIGIELYTVRAQMQASVPKTLATIAQIGYDEVEFAGYFGEKPADVKRYLADNGLKSYSAHVFLDAVRDNLPQTLDDVAEVGHRYVVLGMGDSSIKTLDQFHHYLDFLRTTGEAARAHGLQFGYHNHSFEFKPIEGMIPYDVMLQQVDGGLMKLTMDLYWITNAGADPFAYFAKYPGRFKQCHLKDMAPNREMADVGSGTIDFAKILARRKEAGFEHFYVERDDAPDPYQSARNSLAYLRTLKV